eukprot:4651702-Prorocentrum_lima.AAC.1
MSVVVPPLVRATLHWSGTDAKPFPEITMFVLPDTGPRGGDSTDTLGAAYALSLIHISEPTRLDVI